MDSSRLSKLLDLLSASSSVLREQATIQIAEIVGAHSAEAGPLLLKVRHFLRENSWDARYAAAKTIGEVSSICSNQKNADNQNDVHRNSVSIWSVEFDLNAVLESGFVLVGSEGREYEKNETEIPDAFAQKIRFKEQLGIPTGLEVGVDDLVSEEDFLTVKNENGAVPTAPNVKSTKFDDDEDPTNLENELTNCKSAEGREKLWWFFRLLCHDLYNPVWTVRHGAALGLKEIQKHLSGSDLYLTKIFSSSRHSFFVLATDRFDDFMGNHAVGPVRESCAQVLGSLFPLLPKQGREALMKILIQFISDPQAKPWQCVHAGLLMLKYSLPFVLPVGSVNPDLVNSLLHSLCTCVQFQNEEIIIAASQAISPNLRLITSATDGSIVEYLLSIVWNLLLTSRFDIQDDWVRGLVHIAAELGASYPRPYESEHISVLSLFLDHPSIDVCDQAVKCLTAAVENPGSSTWTDQGMLHVLRMIFFRTLTSRDQRLTESIEKLWLSLINRRSRSDVVLPACPFFGQWLTSLMVNETYPLVDPGLLGFASDRQIFLGGEDVMALNEFDRFVAVTTAKSNASRLLAHLAIRLCELKTVENDLETALSSLENCLIFHLQSSSIIRKSVVCNLLIEWAKIDHDLLSADISFPFSFSNLIRENLTASSILFEELLQKLTELNSVYNKDISKHSNGDRQDICMNFNTVSGLRESVEFCRNLISEESKNCSIFKEFYSKLTDVQQQINRLLSWFACISVRFFRLPEKLNPIIIPLMDIVKSERISMIVDEASECLASLLIRTISRQPSPSFKILKNLISIHCSDENKTPPYLRISEDENCLKIFNSDRRLFSLDQDPVRKKTTDVYANYLIPSVSASNAGCVLRNVCSIGGDRLIDILWKVLIDLPDEECQELVSSLQVLETVFSSLPANLQRILMNSSKTKFVKFIPSKNFAVRNMIARCIAAFAATDILFVINEFLPKLLTFLADPANESARIGSMETIFLLVEEAKVNVVGVASVMALPVLARMSDLNLCVRQMASQCFGSLVKQLPLELNTEIANLSEEVKTLVLEQRLFLQLLARPDDLAHTDLPMSDTKAVLRPYQKDGVNWLLFLNKFNLHGILCDDMGLGKTLQTLCCLAFSSKNILASSPMPPSMIVCPKTLVQHWVDETSRFFDCSILRAMNIDNAGVVEESLFAKFNIFVVSYDYLRKENKLLFSRKWNYVILDEGHIIKNPKTLTAKAVTQLKCEHRLVLSGTPIQNNVLELWSLFEFLIPGYLGDRKQFQQRFGKPILGARDAKASSNEMRSGQAALDSLHKMVLPFILRRRKADVLDDLPPKIVQDYACILSPLQKKLYQDFSQTVLERLNDESAGSPRNAFHFLTYLRKLCDHPCLVLTSDHVAYRDIVSDLKSVYGCENLDDISLSGKCVALRQLLSECGIGGHVGDTEEDVPAVSTHRALIFCQFKSVVDLIADYFSRNVFGSLSFLRLDGTIPPAERQSVADKFNQDPSIDVLLLTTHIGGLGLNLTGADVVIFVDHDWNPAKDLQAMDRAHRIGQKRTVNVYRLISQGSLEEKIMRLQIFKTQNADAVIGQENRSLASMATEQLLDLLTVDNAPASASNGSKNQKKKSSTSVQEISMDLPALWDQSQYEDAFDFNKFIQSMQR